MRRRLVIRGLLASDIFCIGCRVVAVDVVFVVNVSIVDHVLVLVHERAAFSQNLHVHLLPLHQLCIERVDDGLPVLMLHQIVHVLLVHRWVVLIYQKLELWIVHELVWVELVHFEESLIVLMDQLSVPKVSIFLLLLDALLLLDSLPFLFLVQLLSFR